MFFFKTAARKAAWTTPILVAPHGREAIEILTRVAAGDASLPPLACVLLDLKMPFATGLEVLQWMRAQPPLQFIPAVILTSSEQESDIVAAYRLGASSFLVKPSEPQRMGELLQVIEAYWKRHNRLPSSTLERLATAQPFATR